MNLKEPAHKLVNTMRKLIKRVWRKGATIIVSLNSGDLRKHDCHGNKTFDGKSITNDVCVLKPCVLSKR